MLAGWRPAPSPSLRGVAAPRRLPAFGGVVVGLLGVTVIHRYGRIVPGEPIVLVLAASSHRHDAFAAAEFLMDFLKTRAPFWKQVEAAGATNWVEAKQSDDSAAERWSGAPPRNRGAAE